MDFLWCTFEYERSSIAKTNLNLKTILYRCWGQNWDLDKFRICPERIRIELETLIKLKIVESGKDNE